MAGAEILIFLLVAVAVLAGLGLRYDIPYPVVLVVGGLLLGLVPGVPAPELEPDLVFFAFLPPLLYASAFQASAYELRAQAAPITLLAVGLVLATVAGVAAVAHWVVGLPWPVAFLLGAVLGPTDPVSATAVLGRLGAPARLRTILEGESLVNDGTGLTAYGVALSAVGAASLSVADVAGEFVLIAAGGIAVGAVIGLVFARLRMSTGEASIDVVLSVLTPFAAYVAAEELGVSGVLAVVTAGVLVGTRSLDLAHAGARLQTLAFWRASEFMLNSLLFLLIGLQVTQVVGDIEDIEAPELGLHVAAVSAAVLLLRLGWMFVVPALARLTVVPTSGAGGRERLVLGWSGMRGGVSLAAALAIPVTVPDRELVIVLAYATVLVTLVLPGLTLAPLMQRLGLVRDAADRREEVEARHRLTRAALEHLDGADGPEDLVTGLRDRYEARLDALARGAEARSSVADSGRLQIGVLEAEREELRRMRRERAFPAELLRGLESELDVEEARVRAR